MEYSVVFPITLLMFQCMCYGYIPWRECFTIPVTSSPLKTQTCYILVMFLLCTCYVLGEYLLYTCLYAVTMYWPVIYVLCTCYIRTQYLHTYIIYKSGKYLSLVIEHAMTLTMGCMRSHKEKHKLSWHIWRHFTESAASHKHYNIYCRSDHFKPIISFADGLRVY